MKSKQVVIEATDELKIALVGRGKRQRCVMCLPDGTPIAERKNGKWVSIPGGPVVEDYSHLEEADLQ